MYNFNPQGYAYAGMETSAYEHGGYSYENYALGADYYGAYGVPDQPGVSFPLMTITPPPPTATDNFWQSVHDVEFLRKVNDFRRLGLAVKVDDCPKIEHTPPHLRGRLILPVEWRQQGAFTSDDGGWSAPMIASLTGAFTAFPSLDVHEASLSGGSGHAVEAHLFGTMKALERCVHIVRAWAPLVMVVPIPDGIQTDFLDPGREDLRTIESLCHVVISVHNTSFLSVGAPVGGLSDLVGAIWKLCELMDSNNSYALLANSRMDIILPERYCNCLAYELEAVAASTQTSISVLSEDPDAVEPLLDVTAEASTGDNATTSPENSGGAAAGDKGVKKEREAGATAGSAKAVPKLADVSALDYRSIVNDEKIVRIVGSPEGVLQARKLLTNAMPVILELSVRSDFVFDLTVLQKYDALNKIRLNGVYDSFEGPNERTISFCTKERELSVLLNIGREIIAQAWPDEQEPRGGGSVHHQPQREFVPAPPSMKRGLNPDAQEFRPMGFREPENLVQQSRFQATVSSFSTPGDQQRVVQEQLRTSHCDAEAHAPNDAPMVDGGLRTRVRSGRRRNSQNLRRSSEEERNNSTGDDLEKEGLEKLQQRISECEVFFDKKATRTTGKQGYTSSSQQVDWSRASSLRPQPALVNPARNREPQRPSAVRSLLHNARVENCRPYSSLFPTYQQPDRATTVPSRDLDGTNGSPTRSLRRTSESLAAHPLAVAAEKPSVERTIELNVDKSTPGLVPTPAKNAEAAVKALLPDRIANDAAAVVPKTELPARSNENATSNFKKGKDETFTATSGPLPRCWATEVEEVEKLCRDTEKRKSMSAFSEKTEEKAEAAPKVITVPAGPVLLQRNKPAVALQQDFEEVRKGKKKNKKGRKGKKCAGESPEKSEKDTVSNEQIILDTYGDATEEEDDDFQTPPAEDVTPKKEVSTVTSALAEASTDRDGKDLSRPEADAAAIPSTPPPTAVFSYKAALSRDPEQARAERAAREQAVREKAQEEEKARQEEERKQRCEDEERKKQQLAEDEHGKYKLVKKDDKRREDRGPVRRPRRVEVQRYDPRRNHVPRRREEESEYGKIKLLRKGEAPPGAEVPKKQEANREVPKCQEEAGTPKTTEKKEVSEPEKAPTPVTPASKIPVAKSYAAALLRSSDSSNGKGGNVQQMAPSGVSSDLGKNSARKSAAGGNTLLANDIKKAIFMETPRRGQQSPPRRGAPTGTRRSLRGDGITGNPPRSSCPGTSNASAPLSTVNGRHSRSVAADNSKPRQQQQRPGDREQREGGRTRGSPDVNKAHINDKEQRQPSAAGAGSPLHPTTEAAPGRAPDKPSVSVIPAALSGKTAAVPTKKKLRGGPDVGSARRV